eukprot:1674425-Pleurochrysis_carterae.AAC.1
MGRAGRGRGRERGRGRGRESGSGRDRKSERCAAAKLGAAFRQMPCFVRSRVSSEAVLRQGPLRRRSAFGVRART